MEQRLFCQYSPAAYRISVAKCKLVRYLTNGLSGLRFACQKSARPLAEVVCRHESPIRRRLGSVDMQLQENKAVNLSLASPRVNGVLIRPGETFSFWKLVGDPTARRGYRPGLTIAGGTPRSGIGGGMCQFTNLVHWMVLHTPLEITEHHHHDGYDLFPDCGRKIPFGTGTSILYNYLDYRFKNETADTYQLLTWTEEDTLCGELRCDREQERAYRVSIKNERFVREGDAVYRVGEVWRDCVDAKTGVDISRELLRANHAKVMYDVSGFTVCD